MQYAMEEEEAKLQKGIKSGDDKLIKSQSVKQRKMRIKVRQHFSTNPREQIFRGLGF